MTKGERTKKRITLAARELFSNRGYTCVTMKDICLAADISRGGLYAHFSSTAEILEHIIELEQQQAKKALDDAVKNNIRPDHIIRGFLNKRAHEICDTANSLTGAIHEFARSSQSGKLIVTKRANDAVDILTEMIKLGQNQNIFKNIDAKNYAHSILWLLEGMDAHAELIGVDEESARKQLNLVIEMILKN